MIDNIEHLLCRIIIPKEMTIQFRDSLREHPNVEFDPKPKMPITVYFPEYDIHSWLVLELRSDGSVLVDVKCRNNPSKEMKKHAEDFFNELFL